MLLVVAPFWTREDMEINVVALEEMGLTDDVVAFLLEAVLVTCLAEETVVFWEDVLIFLLDVVEILTTGVLIFLVAKGTTAGVLDLMEVLLDFLEVVLVFLEDVLDFLREEELDFNTYLTVVWLVALERTVDTLLEAVPPATRVGDWLAGR
jgi:hypothetical protein